jgi:hypothetical protein
MELFGTISVDFNGTHHLLIIYSAFAPPTPHPPKKKERGERGGEYRGGVHQLLI